MQPLPPPSTLDSAAASITESLLSSAEKRSIRYLGLHGAAKGWLIAKLLTHHHSLLIVCKDRSSAEDLTEDLAFFIRNVPIVQLPGWDTLPFEQVSPQTMISAQRLAALDQITRNQRCVVVTSGDALSQRTLPYQHLAAAAFTISEGELLAKTDLIARLERAGFTHVSLVEEVGEMAVRGGVVDFFPAEHAEPVRVTCAETGAAPISIKAFDADSQRTSTDHTAVRVTPVREILQASTFSERDLERLKLRAKQLEVPPSEFANWTAAFQSTDLEFPGLELAQVIAAPELSSVVDLLPTTMRVIIADELGISQSLDQLAELIIERTTRLASGHLLIPDPERFYLTAAELLQRLRSREPIYIDQISLLSSDDQIPSVHLHSVSNTELATKLRSKIGSGKALAPLTEYINTLRSRDWDLAFVVGSENRAERLQRLLLEENLDARIVTQAAGEWLENSRRAPLTILQGHLSSGVQLPTEKLAFIAENEIFGERSYRRKVSKTSVKKLLSSLAQLKDDDYVVHVDYGIGIYRGLKHIELDGMEGDFLHIDYSDSKLYLPVQNINKVQKFSASEGQLPILDKLGSNRWIKTRQKVKESVITLAGDLIKLYASRTIAKGWRYEPKGAEDDRFADGFAYNETVDQLKAISETIKDMSTEKPMDRLICGDVGFGKTEVALRAAFKATQHARQVAVLVPTTILVEQHRANFADRFEGYPVKVAAVSRFFTAQQNKETLEKVASGEIDIIIGTHRLLSRDVQFKDLGLLIIDEEHRFGVKQKEKLKALRKNIDVLTLTATPIPRTLHMSLLDIRDISLITTPPHDRKTIRTYVAQTNDTTIRDAILREHQRGGQSFFLHNRVETIGGVTARLQEQIPEVKFVFAHGQMAEDELEEIMQRFIKREADVLVSTTIIESGLDIPNANTIIIDRADTLGLAQLYQLRGRVGRSTRQAYCYLLIPSTRNLSADAQKRLKVLQSLDDLGLGFNLAMQDMEIRGAGNLLGKEQSGSVLAVGFDLYTRILQEAVAEIKGEELELEDIIDPEVKLGVNAYIPDHYVPDISERLVLYQRLGGITDPGMADDLFDEIQDRFGPLPREVKSLVELMRLRAVFRRYGVVKGEFVQGRLHLSFSPKARVDGNKVIALVQKDPARYRFSKSLTFSIYFPEIENLESPLQLFKSTETALAAIQLTPK